MYNRECPRHLLVQLVSERSEQSWHDWREKRATPLNEAGNRKRVSDWIARTANLSVGALVILEDRDISVYIQFN